MPLAPRSRKPSTVPGRIAPWPSSERPLEEIAAQVEYRGSPEHKDYPHPLTGEAPGLRSDHRRCARFPVEEWETFDAVLRAAILAGCVSGEDVDPHGYPRYVWAWYGGSLYEARRLSVPSNAYKAYELEWSERPLDRERRLERLKASS